MVPSVMMVVMTVPVVMMSVAVMVVAMPMVTMVVTMMVVTTTMVMMAVVMMLRAELVELHGLRCGSLRAVLLGLCHGSG
jgi:hypothetical protein